MGRDDERAAQGVVMTGLQNRGERWVREGMQAPGSVGDTFILLGNSSPKNNLGVLFTILIPGLHP